MLWRRLCGGSLDFILWLENGLGLVMVEEKDVFTDEVGDEEEDVFLFFLFVFVHFDFLDWCCLALR